MILKKDVGKINIAQFNFLKEFINKERGFNYVPSDFLDMLEDMVDISYHAAKMQIALSYEYAKDNNNVLEFNVGESTFIHFTKIYSLNLGTFLQYIAASDKSLKEIKEDVIRNNIIPEELIKMNIKRHLVIKDNKNHDILGIKKVYRHNNDIEYVVEKKEDIYDVKVKLNSIKSLDNRNIQMLTIKKAIATYDITKDALFLHHIDFILNTMLASVFIGDKNNIVSYDTDYKAMFVLNIYNKNYNADLRIDDLLEINYILTDRFYLYVNYKYLMKEKLVANQVQLALSFREINDAYYSDYPDSFCQTLDYIKLRNSSKRIGIFKSNKSGQHFFEILKGIYKIDVNYQSDNLFDVINMLKEHIYDNYINYNINNSISSVKKRVIMLLLINDIYAGVLLYNIVNDKAYNDLLFKDIEVSSPFNELIYLILTYIK